VGQPDNPGGTRGDFEYERINSQDGDSASIAAALGDIARAKGMSQIARDAGLGRESLYKALSAEGNPEFATIMKVVAALGLRLHASPIRAGG
jgi:probable addiction module antidote protein